MSATYELQDTGYPNSLRPELHKALEAHGIDYWVAQGITFWNRDDGCECLAYGYKANGVPKLAVKIVGFTDPEQAIAATVGGTVWEPSKEWKAWHESLKHDNPTTIREAVENILFDAIDFGDDMGPNGNVWSGVDEGDVLTEKCIDEWVRSIESVAATAGTGTCHIESSHSYDTTDGAKWFFELSCHTLDEWPEKEPPSFCPHCGAKLVDE